MPTPGKKHKHKHKHTKRIKEDADIEIDDVPSPKAAKTTETRWCGVAVARVNVESDRTHITRKPTDVPRGPATIVLVSVAHR